MRFSKVLETQWLWLLLSERTQWHLECVHRTGYLNITTAHRHTKNDLYCGGTRKEIRTTNFKMYLHIDLDVFYRLSNIAADKRSYLN